MPKCVLSTDYFVISHKTAMKPYYVNIDKYNILWIQYAK